MTGIPPKCQVCLDLDIEILNASRSCQFDVLKRTASNGCGVCNLATIKMSPSLGSRRRPYFIDRIQK